MAVKTAVPCLAAVEAYPRMAYGRGWFLRAEAAGDLLLGLRGPLVAFGLVGGRRDGRVGQEPQHVGLAVPEALQQEPGRRLLALGAEDAADLGQSDAWWLMPSKAS